MSRTLTHFLALIFLFRSAFGDVIPSYASEEFPHKMEEQTLQSILVAIEGRLRNLDSIYTTKLTPTLETRLEQYQMKLDALDSRIIRLESLVMLSLDKISENISTKNFKDDIANTNIHRKVDNVYEGLSHRLNYIDRKLDHNLIKIQGKLDIALSKLEKLDNSITTKDVDMDADLSEAFMAMDSLKTSYSSLEEVLSADKNIAVNTTINMQNQLSEKINKIDDKIEKLTKVANLDLIINKTVGMVVENNEILGLMRKELREDLNNYAVKVADMGTYSGKTGEEVQTQVNEMTESLQAKMSLIENALYSIISHLLKSEKNSPEVLEEKMDASFEKILENQEKFLEGCHRVQMDESQIESEISRTLEKLIDMIQKREDNKLKDMENIEKIIKIHDNKITRGLTQANNNIVTLFEKTKGSSQFIESEIKKLCHEIDALFFVINDATKVNRTQVNTVLNELALIKTKLNLQTSDTTLNFDLLKIMLEDIKNSTTNSNVENITQTLNNIEQKINDTNIDPSTITRAIEEAFLTHFPNIVTSKPNIEDNTNTTLNSTEIARREKQIELIFGPLLKNQTQVNPIIVNENETSMVLTPDDNLRPYMLDLIDVRAEDNQENNTSITEK